MTAVYTQLSTDLYYHLITKIGKKSTSWETFATIEKHYVQINNFKYKQYNLPCVVIHHMVLRLY